MALQIGDKLHRILVNEMVEIVKQSFSNKDEFYIEIEKPYNFYGARGFVDIYFCYCSEKGIFSKRMDHHIYEIKPMVSNFGEAIRQLKQARDVILMNRFNDHYSTYLVCLNTSENMEVLKENWSSLSSIDPGLNLVIIDMDTLKDLNKTNMAGSDDTDLLKDLNEMKTGSDMKDFIFTLPTKKLNEKELTFDNFDSNVRNSLNITTNATIKQQFEI